METLGDAEGEGVVASISSDVAGNSIKVTIKGTVTVIVASVVIVPPGVPCDVAIMVVGGVPSESLVSEVL